MQEPAITPELVQKHNLMKQPLIVVNKSPLILDPQALKQRVYETYGCEVAAVLPHSDEMLNLASSGIFAVAYPNHPVTDQYRQVADRVAVL